MKKELSTPVLIFLILLAFFLGIFFLVVSKRFAPSIPPPVRREISLGIGIYNSDNVEFFNKYAREDDYISTRPQFIELLDSVKIGEKMLIFTTQEDVHKMISLAKENDVGVLGYNLEGPFSKEDLVSGEKETYELAKANGLLFIFGPTAFNLEKYYQDFAQHVDVLVLQSQRYQTREDYEEIVETLIAKIKSANPKVKVWVQVSVNPPGNREITADEVIQNIQVIEDKADSIFIYYVPGRSSVMEEVFKKLRTQ